MNYYWVRIYDYNLNSEIENKGTLLNEYYMCGIELNKEEVKAEILLKYNGLKFAKPRKTGGLYALVMESTQHFYNRFHHEIDTICFDPTCQKRLKGKAHEFPQLHKNYLSPSEEPDRYFCSHKCKANTIQLLRYEGEFQSKEPGCHGSIFGYIYLIYNRAENKYYIGQTRFMPFFRWQEHVKAGFKGDIQDLSFSVITEVYKNLSKSENDNQIYLNNIEAFWINKYIEDGFQVINDTKPRITINYLVDTFEKSVSNQLKICL